MEEYSTYSDAELVGLISDHDRKAFATLYDRHWENLFFSAKSCLADDEVCMDLVQDVFLWLWEHRIDLQITHVKSFLTAAARYQVANYIRHRKIHEKYLKQVVSTEGDYVDSVDAQVEVKELKNIIRICSEDLPMRCQEIYSLSREKHWSNKEIAKHLDISEKTVENQITIALRRLRLELRKENLIPLLIGILFLFP